MVSTSFYSSIDTWEKWYKGKVAEFHTYEVFQAKGQKTCVEMQSLGMPKKVCEDWADLLFNEETFIVIDDKNLQETFDSVLEENNFSFQCNELIEKAFALGNGALVLRKNAEGKTRIDYVNGDMVFPLAWENGQVTSCAFGSVFVEDGQKYFYLQAHEKKGKQYVISNRFYPINKNTGNVSLTATVLENVEEEVTYNTEKPLFALIRPAIANNIDKNNPLGISVYANAIDQVKVCDIAFDGVSVSMKVGRPRIAVSETMVSIDKDGNMIPITDKRDTTFYNLPAKINDGQKQLIQDITPAYRANDYMTTLEKALFLLSQKVGFGDRAYKFENGSVTTATQVISENSDMYKTMKKHQKVLTAAFTALAYGIFFLEEKTVPEKLSITVNYDDSIIEDTAAQKAQSMSEVNAGIMAKWEYRQEYFGEDEETAKANVPPVSQYPRFDFTNNGGGE